MGWIQRFDADGTRIPDGERRKVARYRAGYYGPDGKIRSKTFSPEAGGAHAAAAWLRDSEGAKEAGSWVDPSLGRQSFAEFFEWSIETAGHLKPKTRFDYELLARRWILPAFGQVPLNVITVADCKRLLASIERPATCHAVFRVLRRTFQAATDEGRIARNPAARLKVAKAARRRIRFLSPDQLAALAAAAPDRYRALILVLGYGGLRIGEASALQVGDFDAETARLVISRNAVEVGGRIVIGETKTDRIRTVLLPDYVASELADHIGFYTSGHYDDLVFTGSKGGMIRATSFRSAVLEPAAREAKIDPAPRIHDLRHTAVAIAIMAGYHAKEVQELAGHSSIAVTFDVYGHLLESLQAKSVARLDAIARSAKGLPPASATG